MFLLPRPARSDDGDMQAVGQRREGFIGIALLDPVVRHAGEKDFPCAPGFGFRGPVEEAAFGGDTSAVEVAYPFAVLVIRVDGDDTDLHAEVAGNLVYQLRIPDGGGVYRHLIGSGTEHD